MLIELHASGCARPKVDQVGLDDVVVGEDDVERSTDDHVRFIPDLAVETLSPSTAAIDRGSKREMLARYSLPEYWIVDPATRAIEVSVLRGRAYDPPTIISGGVLVSPTLAGLEVDVALLFVDL